MTTTLPYGTWPSPLSAADLAGGTVRLEDLQADGDRLWWTEQRPAEDGRTALVALTGVGPRDVGGAGDLDVRTRVHEYGGGAFTARDEVVVASHDDDGRLHRVDDHGAAPITAASAVPRGVRFADGQLVAAGTALLCVRETHPQATRPRDEDAAPPPDEDAAQLGNENPPEPRNEVVLVDLATGVQRVLVSGPDFVAAPRLSPAEDELAWLAWDHPEMPWDGARLQVASYDPLASPGGDDDGTVGPAIHLGGGGGTAATRPVWRPDGTLVTTLDTSGYWEVHVRDGEGLRPVTSLGADVGVPLWRFGDDVLAPLGDGRIAAVVIDRAVARLVLVDLADGAVTELGAPYTSIRQLRATAAGVAFLGASPDVAGAVVRWSPEDGFEEVATIEVAQLHAGDHPTAAAVEVATDDGATTHAFLYRPANAEVTGPDDERPPLVVFTHGGPTGNVGRVLSPAIAYWTTRGFAVADVNYRGSSGYGRAYRDQLRGAWGLHDVADTIAVATELARRGEVDGDRMVIRGGSAGGFTTLAVLTAPAHPFAAGTSFFGVSDLAGLAEHTHKFESRYLDGLVGPYPEAADVYRERSPLTHVDRLRTPVLVLQGLEDRVVPPEQAEAITAAAAERGLPHAYLAFPGEQHGFRKAENVVTWLQSELAFYGQVLGFTPAGDLPHLDLGDR